jgi:hypothetical protein
VAKLLPFLRSRPRGAASTDLEPTSVAAERGFSLIAALLFVASLLRVARAVWAHETFETEATLALLFVIGLPWLALRWRR